MEFDGTNTSYSQFETIVNLGLSIDPHNPRYHYMMAMVLYEKRDPNQHSKIKEHLNKAMTITSGCFVEACFLMAEIYEMENQIQNAITYYKKAIDRLYENNNYARRLALRMQLDSNSSQILTYVRRTKGPMKLNSNAKNIILFLARNGEATLAKNVLNDLIKDDDKENRGYWNALIEQVSNNKQQKNTKSSTGRVIKFPNKS